MPIQYNYSAYTRLPPEKLFAGGIIFLLSNAFRSFMFVIFHQCCLLPNARHDYFSQAVDVGNMRGTRRLVAYAIVAALVGNVFGSTAILPLMRFLIASHGKATIRQ